ncbi:cytochrome b5 [Suhomyces tanzawaensis NRRL Y-17324]|uniref:Cytochrome b5 n=1 Tax=Suhomyces tanzawaensis NRRL Y-17324 TaxID=984487 RepID=A0A1E4SRX4_9ASCO|nr:cytochrome b5 [Suhomyces tanzawaensis NRRL Y-17324]ODV82269.1 cytochrome b5 [Suhomyces tanzawaensis NRRL Y-17324]
MANEENQVQNPPKINAPSVPKPTSLNHEAPMSKPISAPRSSLARPASTFPAINSAQRASGGLAVPGQQSRRKVVLKPGHSPLDWAHLNSSKPKHILRGVPPNTPPPQYVQIPKEELKKHKTQEDCWTCINGRVFNITPYINFHPGGVEEIMKCAGRDGTALFNKYHSWVNADRMLENCMVGIISN